MRAKDPTAEQEHPPRWTANYPKVRRLLAFDPAFAHLCGFAASAGDYLAKLAIARAEAAYACVEAKP